MVVFEGGATKKSDYRRFKVRGERATRATAAPTTSPRWRRCWRGASTRYLEQADLSPARRQARRELRLAALADHDRRRQGPAGGRDAGAAAVRRARRHRRQPRQARGGGLRPRPLGAARPAADSEASQLLQRVRDEAHRFAIEHHRGRRDRAMTGSVLDELKGDRPGPQARPAAALRLPGAVPRRHPRGARGGARPAWQSRPRDPRAAEQDRLRPSPRMAKARRRGDRWS